MTLKYERLASLVNRSTLPEVMAFVNEISIAKISDKYLWDSINSKILPDIVSFHPTWLSKLAKSFVTANYIDHDMNRLVFKTFQSKLTQVDITNLSIFFNAYLELDPNLSTDEINKLNNRLTELLHLEDATHPNSQSLMLLLSMSSKHPNKISPSNISLILTTIAASAPQMSPKDVSHAIFLSSKLSILSPHLLQNFVSRVLPAIQPFLFSLDLKEICLLSNAISKAGIPTLPFHHLLLTEAHRRLNEQKNLHDGRIIKEDLVALKTVSMLMHAFAKTDTASKSRLLSSVSHFALPTLTHEVLFCPPSRPPTEKNRELENSLCLLANGLTCSNAFNDNLLFYLISSIIAPPPVEELHALHSRLRLDSNNPLPLEDYSPLISIRAPFSPSSLNSICVLYKALALYKVHLHHNPVNPADDPLANYYLPAVRRASKWLMGCVRMKEHEMGISEAVRLCQILLSWTVSRPTPVLQSVIDKAVELVYQHLSVKDKAILEMTENLKKTNIMENKFENSNFSTEIDCAHQSSTSKKKKKQRETRRHAVSLPAPPSDVATILDCISLLSYCPISSLRRLSVFVLSEFESQQLTLRQRLRENDCDAWSLEERQRLEDSALRLEAQLELRGECRIGDALKCFDALRRFALEFGEEYANLHLELLTQYGYLFIGGEKELPLSSEKAVDVASSFLRPPLAMMDIPSEVSCDFALDQWKSVWSRVDVPEEEKRKRMVDILTVAVDGAIDLQLNEKKISKLNGAIVNPWFDGDKEIEFLRMILVKGCFPRILNSLKEKNSNYLSFLHGSRMLEVAFKVLKQSLSSSHNTGLLEEQTIRGNHSNQELLRTQVKQCISDVIHGLCDHAESLSSNSIDSIDTNMAQTSSNYVSVSFKKNMAVHQAVVLLRSLFELQRATTIVSDPSVSQLKSDIWKIIDAEGQVQKLCVLLLFFLSSNANQLSLHDACSSLYSLSFLLPHPNLSLFKKLLLVTHKSPSPARFKPNAAAKVVQKQVILDKCRSAIDLLAITALHPVLLEDRQVVERVNDLAVGPLESLSFFATLSHEEREKMIASSEGMYLNEIFSSGMCEWWGILAESCGTLFDITNDETFKRIGIVAAALCFESDITLNSSLTKGPILGLTSLFENNSNCIKNNDEMQLHTWNLGALKKIQKEIADIDKLILDSDSNSNYGVSQTIQTIAESVTNND